MPLCVCACVSDMTRFPKDNSFPLWRHVCFSVWWPPASFVSPKSNGGCVHAPAARLKRGQPHTSVQAHEHKAASGLFTMDSEVLVLVSFLAAHPDCNNLPPRVSLVVETRQLPLTHLTPADLCINFLFTPGASGEKPDDLCFPNKACTIMRSPSRERKDKAVRLYCNKDPPERSTVPRTRTVGTGWVSLRSKKIPSLKSWKMKS